MALRSKKNYNKNMQRELQAQDKDAFTLADGSEPQSLDDVLKILEDRYAEQMMRQVGLISNDREKKKQNPSSASLPKLRVARPSLDNLLSLAAAVGKGKPGSASERSSVEEKGSKKSKKVKESKKSGDKDYANSFPLTASLQSAAVMTGNAAFSVPATAQSIPSVDASVTRMSPLSLNAAPFLPLSEAEIVPVQLGSIPEYEAQPAQLHAQTSVEAFAAVEPLPFDAPSFGSETAADFFDSIHLTTGVDKAEAEADGAGGMGLGLGGSAHDSIPLSQAVKELEALHAPHELHTQMSTTSCASNEELLYGLQQQHQALQGAHAHQVGYAAYDGSYGAASATTGTYDLFMSYPYPHGAPLP
jgi:hypothetical protein